MEGTTLQKNKKMPRPKSEITLNDLVEGIPDDVRKKKKLAGGQIHKLDPASGMVKPLPQKIVDQDGKPVDNTSIFTLSKQDEVDAYNEAIQKLDPRFSEDISILGRNVLVRVFLDSAEVTTSSGITLIKSKKMANPKKGTGMYGEHSMEERNFPFTTAGIVVNVGDNCDDVIKAGDFVVLSPRAIQEVAIQGTGITRWVNQFTHYNELKVSNADNTGYILINQMDIVGKINKLII